MSKLKVSLLFVLLFFVFTQGMWERLLIFLPDVSYIVDIIAILFIFVQFRFSVKTPVSKDLIIYIITALMIGFANENSIVESLLYIRFVVYSCLIFIQLYQFNLDVKTWNRILRFCLWMVIIQGLGAAYSLFVLGERIEGYVGLMSSDGGTTATVFPLFISSLGFLYYLFRFTWSPRAWLTMCVVLGSVLAVAYASGKRGVYFTIPAFFIITILLTLPALMRRGMVKRKLAGIGVIGILLFPILIYGIINSHGLNYDLSGEESYAQVISKSFTFAEKYESATDQYGRTTGRTNTTLQIIDKSFSNDELFISGAGYGATKEEAMMLRLGYGYGVVGFTRDLISGGWIFSVLTVLLFSRIILTNKSIRTGITRTFRNIAFLVFLYTHALYSSDFTVSLKINLLLVLLLVLVNSPYHKESCLEILRSNKLIR